MTNEQIIEEMTKAYTNAPFPSNKSIASTKRIITRLDELGYQITKIEPDEGMIHEGISSWEKSAFAVVTVFKAMSNAGRVSIEG